MYLYKGKHPESGEKIEKQFEEQFDAEEFAKENYYQFPNFTVENLEDNSIEYSTEIMENEMEANDEMMFPNKD